MPYDFKWPELCGNFQIRAMENLRGMQYLSLTGAPQLPYFSRETITITAASEMTDVWNTRPQQTHANFYSCKYSP
jgi:hypothetical protein